MTRKRLFVPAVLILCLLFAVQLNAEDKSSNSIGDFMQEQQFQQRQQIERLTDPNVMYAGNFNDFPGFDEDIYKINHRSTGRAFLYSLILPGAGEYYTGSKWKAALFLGIEAFSWYGYITNYTSGQDKEDAYRAYANEYWEPGSYRAWLVDVMGVPSDTVPYRDENGEPATFTHHLPGFKTQQYYEMIGKYDQFQYGWTDTDYNSGLSASPHRDAYLSMRNDANNKFDAARNFAIVAIANRVVSAFDAALSAHRLNKRTDRFSEIRVKARLADYHGEKIPKVTFTYKFF
jgi:hypothetical protein